VSTSGNAVVAAFDYHSLLVAGSIFGLDNGIVLGTEAAAYIDIHSDLWIGAAGSVSSGQYLGGSTAVTTFGNHIHVTNEGSIYSGGEGISHLGDYLRVANFGTISAEDSAVHVLGRGAMIENHGVIASHGTAIVAMEDTALLANGSSAITVVNYGTITGASAFQALLVSGTDVFTSTLFNHGTVEGTIGFADGNDLYDGHAGVATMVVGNEGNDTMIGGAGRDVFEGRGDEDSLEGGGGNDLLSGGGESDTLDGGDGDDVLRPGAGLDLIDGGTGMRDWLDYSTSASTGVVVNLTTADASGGDAQGDVFIGIECLRGGAFADVLTGDAAANWLVGSHANDYLAGGGGNDVLFGGRDNDTLIGGAGVDIMRGDGGADVFRFAAASDTGAPGQVRDRILDFVQADGDRIDISAIDANTVLPLAQNFTFIGTGTTAFTDEGQVRAQVILGNTYVYANTDASLGTVEFSMVLLGVINLTAADFLL
jgi:Ca2+-binding RTX toxin-like protein